MGACADVEAGYGFLPASSATTIFRESQLSNLSAWTGSEWEANAAVSYGQVMQQVQKSPQWLFSPRIPGRAEYLATLDKAVQALRLPMQTAKPLSAMRKDVTGYLYGGDVSRKNKLLDKQKRGKKKLLERGRGKVNIPEEVFMKMVQSSAE